MGITEKLKQFYIKTIPGMNNQVEDLDLQDRWVVKAQNCRFEEEPGAVDKRDPITYFNATTLGTGGIVGIHRFYTSDGSARFVVAHGTKAYVGADASGTFTQIRSGLTDSKRTSFAVYKDLLIASNGYDNPWLYDGLTDNVTWELGACKGMPTVAAGSVATGSYIYQVAIGSTAETQHICGAVSNTIAVTSSGTASVTLTHIPLGPVGTTARTLYRTGSTGAGQFSLLAEISDNTTETYVDTIQTASTGTAIGSVNDDMPKGNLLQVHRERLFISGDPNNTSKIYYSNVYLPHYIQQTTNLDYMKISEEDGDVIMGIPIQLGVMLCIKKNSIRKLHITSPVSGADPTTWYADDPSAFVGSPARWSITQSPHGIIFLGWDHWYLFDGASVKPIIDEFDTGDILPASYDDTVGFYHGGIFLAGYTDLEAADQAHDRVMRYNFKRQALSYDTITANCFSARVGASESGELFYGDSKVGYVYKDKNIDTSYLLNNKTMCSAGSTAGGDGTFVGGTESDALIEIGTVSSASAIPDNICILWDSTSSNPGANWTEVSMNGRLIKINSTSGTTVAGNTHTHALTGTLGMSTVAKDDGGDSEGTVTNNNHTHTISGTSATATSALPRFTQYKVYKSSSVTATEFPDGALVFWDQAAAPEGWQAQIGNVGYYIAGASSSLGQTYVFSSTHSHTFSLTSDVGGDSLDSGANSFADYHSPTDHTHTVTGTTNSANTDDWEVASASFRLIKKIGESETWDGSDKYVYCIVDSAAATSNGWSDVTATYADMYLKVGSSTPSTAAANTSDLHTHVIPGGTSSTHSGLGPVYGGYHHQMIIQHDHPYSLTAASNGTSMVPSSRTFTFAKKHLGKMKDYNDAMINTDTAGTWTSPSMQIDASSLDKIYWNETKGASDDVLVHTRTGATKVACEAAGWSAALSDPNGSIIASTADVWFQYKIEFTAADTVVSNPKVSMVGDFIVKFTYTQGGTKVETAVEFIYDVGFRNFDEPMSDKLIKKVGTVHQGSQGSFKLQWATENTNNEFTIDLTTNTSRWESYAQDNALGKEINFKVYKNDLYPFRLSEIKGLYAPQPVIL